jgi:uncharacterized membrane protein
MNLDDQVAEILKKEENEIHISLKDRAADVVSEFGGGWTFIILFMLFCGAWVSYNLIFYAFDSFPFILLNLILSCISVFQAPFILMTQNRLAAIDRKRAENDYIVDLKTSLEIQEIRADIERILIMLSSK